MVEFVDECCFVELLVCVCIVVVVYYVIDDLVCVVD